MALSSLQPGCLCLYWSVIFIRIYPSKLAYKGRSNSQVRALLISGFPNVAIRCICCCFLCNLNWIEKYKQLNLLVYITSYASKEFSNVCVPTMRQVYRPGRWGPSNEQDKWGRPSVSLHPRRRQANEPIEVYRGTSLGISLDIGSLRVLFLGGLEVKPHYPSHFLTGLLASVSCL